MFFGLSDRLVLRFQALHQILFTDDLDQIGRYHHANPIDALFQDHMIHAIYSHLPLHPNFALLPGCASGSNAGCGGFCDFSPQIAEGSLIPPSHPRTASPKEKKPALLWAPAASLGGNACARSGAPPARLRGEAHIATPWIRRCGDNPSSCVQILCQSTYRPPDCDLNSPVGRSCSDETSLSSRRGRRGRR
jgi:hypothetical protein